MIKILNRMYLIFLIIILIIVFVCSFRVGSKIYHLINTNLDDKNTPVKSDVADWNIKVTIEY